MRVSRILVPLAALLCLAVAAPSTSAAVTVGYKTISTGLNRPVYVTNAGDTRLFIVEQPGVVKVLVSGSTAQTYLDLRSVVHDAGNEEGLLGMAFHPDFKATGAWGFGRFYLYLTRDDGNNWVLEGRVPDPNANTASGWRSRWLLTLPHPTYTNHNGGMLLMRREGANSYLYIGTGDGGGAGDPNENAQNKSRLLGKILRIVPSGGGTFVYTIPSSNPFYGATSGDDRVYAYGLRNPWRFSFDRTLGNLWIGDVGQNVYEEVNRAPASSSGFSAGKGRNFGWDSYEARSCFESPCPLSGTTFPVTYYAHSVSGTDNCSVTGGYVYRGGLYSFLRGLYFFADYCSGRIWTVSGTSTSSALSPTLRVDTPFNISSFGESATGELYFTTLSGALYRITGTST